MIKPEMPNMPNIPGMGAMTETLDMMKNFWSGVGMPGMNTAGMNVPGMMMPTLSVEEINKKIADLKAVESWLALNMNMLRSTIQALEVQSATISTLQTMGQNFASSMTPPQQARPAAAGTGASEPTASASAQAKGRRKSQGAPHPTSEDESDAAKLTAPLVNATAWWNMLQDQFKQTVAGAMAGDGSTQQANGGTKGDGAKPGASPSGNGAQPAAKSPVRKRKSS